MFGRLNRYEVIMGTPFEDFEAEVSRYILYEKIATRMGEKGLRTFVPHRDIGKDWPPNKVYDTVINQIIPHANLVLADIGVRQDGIGSSAVGAMVARACQCNVELVTFYEKGRRARDCFPISKEIEYQTSEELLRKIEEEIPNLKFLFKK